MPVLSPALCVSALVLASEAAWQRPALWVPAVVLLGAAAWDLATREIPHAFPLLLVAWALASRLLGFQEWGSLAFGLAVGLAIGLVLFALGWMGAGDGKLLAGLGACIGPMGLLVTLPWIAIAGGVWALLALARGKAEKPDESGAPGKSEVVYGPAIATGYLVAIFV